MATIEWPVRVCVYFDDQEQHDAARASLARLEGEYDGMVIGLVTREGVKSLREKGLFFELEDNQDRYPASSSAPSASSASAGTHDDYGVGEKLGPKSVLPFSLRKLLVRLSEGRETAPAPGDRAVYHVVFSEPMSGAIREQLDKLGVKILSRDPDSGYLMFLTAEQLTAVRALPFVYQTTLLEVKHRITEAYQRLLRSALHEDDEGPLLLASSMDVEPEAPEFDVLVHEPGDLKRVRDVIEASDDPKAQIVDSSDRLIRFRAV